MLHPVSRLPGAILVATALAVTTWAAEPAAPDAPTDAPVAPPALSFVDAAVLGLVEGITEFLPVSSTGHLILANDLLGLERLEPALGSDGRPLWKVPPDEAAGLPGEPFTIKSAADLYAVVIQAGAIAAVALLYWPSILQVLLGLLGRSPAGLRLLRNLLIAFVPAVALGLAAEDFIDRFLFSTTTVAVALVIGAAIMVAADRWQKKRLANTSAAGDLLPADMSPRQALVIGLMQCLSLWPGMSRSMATIVGGYFAGLRPARAAEFSFLLGLPTLAGAAAYKALGHGDLVIAAFGWKPVLLGCAVAAVSAGLAVHWLVGYLNRHGLTLFAVYRVVLAVVVLAVLV